ncbi:SNF2-related protein [Candidatus Solincola sp.]
MEALERIDRDTNRLPRGRTYARSGRVLEIGLAEGKVWASVQGTRPRPYRVSIAFREFTPEEGSKIVLLLAKRPSISCDLSLGKLPEQMLEALEEAGVPLFPSSWKDIRASCSCPDWANPCKHIAAVYYLLANEIDKDPFITFALRGLPAPELRLAAGIPASLAEPGGENTDHFVPCRRVCPSPVPENPGDFHLALQPYDLDGIFALLPDRPLFWEGGDFKKLLRQVYRAVAEGVQGLEIREKHPSLKEVDFHLIMGRGGKAPRFFASHRRGDTAALRKILESLGMTRSLSGYPRPRTLKVPVEVKGGLLPAGRPGFKLAAEEALDLFLSLPPAANLERHSPSSRFLVLAASTAVALASTYHFLPRLAGYGSGRFRVIYVPAASGNPDQDPLLTLEKTFPPSLACRPGGRSVMIPRGVPEIVSLFLTRLVQLFYDIPEPLVHDKLVSAFFRGTTFQPERFDEVRTSSALANWLERLSARTRSVSPVIRVEPSGDSTFRLGVEVEDRRDPMAPYISLAELFTASGPVFSSPPEWVRWEASRQLALAAEYLPRLREVLDSRGLQEPEVSSAEMAELLTRHATTLELLSIRLMLPRELAGLLRPRAAIRASLGSGARPPGFLDLADLLDFQWEISLGDYRLSVEEFRRLATAAEGVVRFKDGYVLLRPDEVKALLRKVSQPPPRPEPAEFLHWALSGERKGIPMRTDPRLREFLRGLSRAEKVDVPSSFRGRLRPYQKRGYAWLYTNAARGLGCCLADDMGLGKTVQALALLLMLKEKGRLRRPALVVCPTTVLGNWEKEALRFAPSLRVCVYHGTGRQLHFEDRDLVITSYGTLRRVEARFRSQEWGAVVVDEAQCIKNPNTGQARAVKSLRAEVRVALSGTPVENHLGELWSIFDFLNPGFLGSLESFRRHFALPIERYRDPERLEVLRKVTGPFILRRLKTDPRIIADLPEKITAEEYCYLTPQQAVLYQKIVDRAMEEVERSSGIQRKGLILSLITHLKQVCDHPLLFTKRGKAESKLSGKSVRALELLERNLRAGEKTLVFTQYVEMGDCLVGMMREELGEEAAFFHGGLPRPARDRMVAEFQEMEKPRIMVVSLRAGGTGLNLTAATSVIHYDLWWNPAVEDQATDRTYRIGQTRNVYVHRLITLHTFEEKIDDLMREKRDLAELTVSKGEKWITELPDRELRTIFELRPGFS